MFGGRGFEFLFCILFVVLPCSISRKRYNLEEECNKLYKEDLDTVLQRFRRTPQYHRILKEKFDEYLKGPFLDIKYQVQRYYLKKQEYKIKELMGINKDRTTTTTQTTTTNTTTTTETPAPTEDEKIEFEDDLVVSKRTPVERLDEYYQKELTVPQRNVMKDLGFQYAGDIIDELIRQVKGKLDIEPPQDRKWKKVVWLDSYGEPEIHKEHDSDVHKDEPVTQNITLDAEYAPASNAAPIDVHVPGDQKRASDYKKHDFRNQNQNSVK